MKRDAKTETEIAGGCAGCGFLILILGGTSVFMGWLCQLIASHFGYHQPLWVFVLGWFLISGLFSQAKGRAE